MRRVVVAVVAVLLTGCGGGPGGGTKSTNAAAARIAVSSPAFANGATIPRVYTCDGRDISPPLRWSGVPAGAGAVSLTIVDPDAPGGAFLHWSVRMPATVTALGAGRVPAGAVQAKNGFGRTGYGGPCPPKGDPPHHYLITVSALAGSSTLATGTLVGTYARR